MVFQMRHSGTSISTLCPSINFHGNRTDVLFQKSDLETSVREIKQKCDEEQKQVSVCWCPLVWRYPSFHLSILLVRLTPTLCNGLDQSFKNASLSPAYLQDGLLTWLLLYLWLSFPLLYSPRHLSN